MPNNKAAKKALRPNIKARAINKSEMNKLKTLKKRLLKSIEEKNIELAQKEFINNQSALAKAAKKHLIHKKKAARLTSRMNDKIKQLKA